MGFPDRQYGHLQSIFSILLLLCLTANTGPALAERPSAQPSSKELQQRQAYFLRERARHNAASRLGYPYIYEDNITSLQQNYMALSQQISELSRLLHAMAERNQPGPGFFPAPPYAPQTMLPAPDPQGNPLSHVYGPKGPTPQSVKTILEYRLMVAGNPRLKAGKVTDLKDRIEIQVVTTDGSLVEEYAVDKRSGYWHLKR